MTTTHRTARRLLGRLALVAGTALAFPSLADAQGTPARPVLLAPEPLSLATGETGFIAKGEPYTPRGQSPEPPVGVPADDGPPLPIPSAEPPQALPRPLPNGGRLVSPAAVPGGVKSAKLYQHVPNRNPAESGSGWGSLMSRLFGRPAKPMPLPPVGQVAAARPAAPKGGAPTQLAHRWYGYGAPVTQDAPQIGEPTQMPPAWYAHTGATAGAMPTGSAQQPTAVASRTPPTVPYEEAYGGQLVRANFDAAAPEPPKVGTVKYAPPPEAVAKYAARPQPRPHEVAKVAPERHDLVPPPPLPPVRWAPSGNDVPPNLSGGRAEPAAIASNRQQPLTQPSNAQRPLQQPSMARRESVTLLAPQPYSGEPPRSAGRSSAPAAAQNNRTQYVARAQSDESFTEPLAEKIRRMCGKYATGVEVKQTGAKALVITLVIGQQAHAEPIANRISELPELAAYEVDFEVRVGK